MSGRPSKSRLLLYGAYGYTGRLAAELAAAKKLDVVLAGRNEDALVPLGDRLSLPTRVVALNDLGQLSTALRDIACVVHMAGPFAATSAPMLSACLATQTNYVDITGEIEVFEAIWSRKEEIRRAGITAVPGAGFDVVPTDCLAGYVASKLERPTSLVIALRGLESASQGTLRTAIRQVSRPVLCRRAGAIVALDDRSPQWIDFGSGSELCIPVSSGDVATAFHSTTVGNITVYFRRTKLFRSADIVGKLFGPLLRSRIGQRALAAMVRRLPEGPSQAERNGHRSTIWAEAIDGFGTSSKARLTTPDPYDFAANSALEIASEDQFDASCARSCDPVPGIRCGFCAESTGMPSDRPPVFPNGLRHCTRMRTPLRPTKPFVHNSIALLKTRFRQICRWVLLRIDISFQSYLSTLVRMSWLSLRHERANWAFTAPCGATSRFAVSRMDRPSRWRS